MENSDASTPAQPAPDRDLIAGFLRLLTDHLEEDEGQLGFAFKDRSGFHSRNVELATSTSPACLDQLAKRNHSGANTYYRVSLLKMACGNTEAASLKNIARPLAWVIDVDRPEGSQKVEQALRTGKWPHALKPSLVVVTSATCGHRRFQLVYLLDDPVAWTDEDQCAQWEARAEALTTLWAGDPPSKRAHQPMRIPGTVNWPDDEKMSEGRRPEVATLAMPETTTLATKEGRDRIERFSLNDECFDRLLEAVPVTPKATTGGGQDAPVPPTEWTDATHTLWDKLSEAERTRIARWEEGDGPRHQRLRELARTLAEHDGAAEDAFRVLYAHPQGAASKAWDEGRSTDAAAARWLWKDVQKSLDGFTPAPSGLVEGILENFGAPRPPAPARASDDASVTAPPVVEGAEAGAAASGEPDDFGGAPADILSKTSPPELPTGVLPKIIEDFARIEGRLTGVDPAGFAVAALATCAAALTDKVVLQPKVHDKEWTQPARLWVGLVADPSTGKSPAVKKAAKPLIEADAKMFRDWQRQMADYNALPKDERAGKPPPQQKRKRLSDATVEAAQEVLKDNPEGVLCFQDELSGWFGAMEKYAGSGKGAMRDRSFWLETFGGGPYTVHRIGRGPTSVENASVCLLGGIQPAPMRRIIRDADDDGLIQRMLPVVLRDQTEGVDERPERDVASAYAALVRGLLERKPPEAPGYLSIPETVPLRFDKSAQEIWRQAEKQHLDLVKVGRFNSMLGAHFGKYNGLFARLCVLFHAIEHAEAASLPKEITEGTARRVQVFLHDFLARHAFSFYHGTLRVEAGNDPMVSAAGYILARGLSEITARDFRRGDKAMRGLSRDDVLQVMQALEVAGWVRQGHSARSDSLVWEVNPAVHRRYREQAEAERKRRAEAHERLQELAERA
jgi:hypothetical protein